MHGVDDMDGLDSASGVGGVDSGWCGQCGWCGWVNRVGNVDSVDEHTPCRSGVGRKGGRGHADQELSRWLVFHRSFSFTSLVLHFGEISRKASRLQDLVALQGTLKLG